MNHPLTRRSGTLSPSQGERDGVRGRFMDEKSRTRTKGRFLEAREKRANFRLPLNHPDKDGEAVSEAPWKRRTCSRRSQPVRLKRSMTSSQSPLASRTVSSAPSRTV